MRALCTLLILLIHQEVGRVGINELPNKAIHYTFTTMAIIDCVANLKIVEKVDGKIFKHSLPMASSGKHIIKAIKCKFNCKYVVSYYLLYTNLTSPQ